MIDIDYRMRTRSRIMSPIFFASTLIKPAIFHLATLFARTDKKVETLPTTDLNYWIKHPFEFSDPILKPEYL